MSGADGQAMATHATVRGTATPEHRAPAIERVRVAIRSARATWIVRRERAWLGVVGVPLAMTATGLVKLWWTWPLLLVCSWTCTPSWRWSWMLALEEALVGLQWAFVGAAAPRSCRVRGSWWARCGWRSRWRSQERV